MNEELERTTKKVVLLYVLSRHFPGGHDEDHKNLSRGSRSLDRGSNGAHPEYKFIALLLDQPVRAIIFVTAAESLSFNTSESIYKAVSHLGTEII
jgi:hypothetical protein